MSVYFITQTWLMQDLVWVPNSDHDNWYTSKSLLFHSILSSSNVRSRTDQH